MYHAALAYEQCDRSYKPKFAEPKPQTPRFNNGYDSYDRYEGPGYGAGPSVGYDNYKINSGKYNLLSIKFCAEVK